MTKIGVYNYFFVALLLWVSQLPYTKNHLFSHLTRIPGA